MQKGKSLEDTNLNNNPVASICSSICSIGFFFFKQMKKVTRFARQTQVYPNMPQIYTHSAYQIYGSTLLVNLQNQWNAGRTRFRKVIPSTSMWHFQLHVDLT